MLRVFEHLRADPGFDHIPVLHHDDLVRQRPHNPQIMADEQIGQPPFPLQGAQKVDDLHLHRHVQRAGRLVQHHKLRAQDHRAGNRHALTLPAREFMRIAAHRGRVQTDLGHDVGHHLAFVAARLHAMHAQTFGDDLFHRHAGRQAAERVLKHDLQVAAQIAQVLAMLRLQVLPKEHHRPGRRDQPQDRQRQSGLARATFPHDAQRFAGAHRQRGIIDRLHIADRAAQEAAMDREPDAQAFGAHNLHRIRRYRVGAALWFGRQQLLRIGMLGCCKNLRRGTLFHNLAALHHADPVGNAPHHAKVMGDEQQA